MEVLVEFSNKNGHLRLLRHKHGIARRTERLPRHLYHQEYGLIYHTIEMSTDGENWGLCAEFTKRVTRKYSTMFHEMASRLMEGKVKIEEFDDKK